MPDTRKPTQPNVLVIMSDQHHAGVLGCAGDPVADTPNLDRLAAGGVRFTNTYCTYPLCGPSRMSFMTGCQPHEIDCWSNESQISSDITTFAHAFLAGGYLPILSGRMHFVGPDQRHGFVQKLLGDVPESAHLAAGWKLKGVLGDLVDTPGYGRAGILKSGPGRTGYHAYDERVTDLTVNWLRQRANARSQEQPFLLVAGYAAPHCPFVAPPEDFDYFASRIHVRDLPPREERVHPAVEVRRATLGELPVDAQWRTRVAYYGLCRFLDRQVGRVLAALEESGLASDTLVVYTSDHGEMLGEHGWWWKSTFYEGAMRVPMLVTWPGRLRKGLVVPHNVSLADVGPTLLDLAGAPTIPSASGRSFRPLLDDNGTGWDNTVYAEQVSDFGRDRLIPERMMNQDNWKYIYHHGMQPELFDLASDPREEHDRSSDPSCSERLAAMQALALRGWDPDFVVKRYLRFMDSRALLRKWIETVALPEPDPMWFDAPLENRVDASRKPAAK